MSSTNPNPQREKTFAEQIDDYQNGRLAQSEQLKICDTPAVLTMLGLEQLPMTYTQNHLNNAMKPKNPSKHQHGLTKDFLERVPEMMGSSVMIMDSSTKNDSVVVVLSSKETDVDNSPIIATIAANGTGQYQATIIPANVVTSIYGRDNFSNFIQNAVSKNNILFYDKKKCDELETTLINNATQKSQAPTSLSRLQFSGNLIGLDSNTIIHQSNNIVNANPQIVTKNSYLQNNMTMTDLLDRYHELDQKMQEVSSLSTSQKDRETIAEYQELKGQLR